VKSRRSDRSGSRSASPARSGGARATAPVPFGPALAPWPLDSSRTSCRRGLRTSPDCPGITLLATHQLAGLAGSHMPRLAVLSLPQGAARPLGEQAGRLQRAVLEHGQPLPACRQPRAPQGSLHCAGATRSCQRWRRYAAIRLAPHVAALTATLSSSRSVSGASCTGRPGRARCRRGCTPSWPYRSNRSRQR